MHAQHIFHDGVSLVVNTRVLQENHCDCLAVTLTKNHENGSIEEFDIHLHILPMSKAIGTSHAIGIRSLSHYSWIPRASATNHEERVERIDGQKIVIIRDDLMSKYPMGVPIGEIDRHVIHYAVGQEAWVE